MSKLSGTTRAVIALLLMMAVFFGINYLNSIKEIPDGTLSVDCNETTYRVNCLELFEGKSQFTMREMVDCIMKNPSSAEHVAVIGLDKDSVDVPVESFADAEFTITEENLVDFVVTIDGATTEIDNVKWMFIE